MALVELGPLAATQRPRLEIASGDDDRAFASALTELRQRQQAVASPRDSHAHLETAPPVRMEIAATTAPVTASKKK